jgi:hypothetical protein
MSMIKSNCQLNPNDLRTSKLPTTKNAGPLLTPLKETDHNNNNIYSYQPSRVANSNNKNVKQHQILNNNNNRIQRTTSHIIGNMNNKDSLKKNNEIITDNYPTTDIVSKIKRSLEQKAAEINKNNNLPKQQSRFIINNNISASTSNIGQKILMQTRPNGLGISRAQSSACVRTPSPLIAQNKLLQQNKITANHIRSSRLIAKNIINTNADYFESISMVNDKSKMKQRSRIVTKSVISLNSPGNGNVHIVKENDQQILANAIVNIIIINFNVLNLILILFF